MVEAEDMRLVEHNVEHLSGIVRQVAQSVE
jgi:hypothetical protein